MLRGKVISSVAVAFVAVASVAGAATAVADPLDSPIDTNLPPRVALSSPTDGFVGVLGCQVGFAAVAVDSDSLILPDDGIDRGPFVPAIRGKNTAFARAYGGDTPQLSADSQAVSFLMTDPPPGQPDDPCLKATPPTHPLEVTE